MIKWLIILSLIAIPIIFLIMSSFEEKEIKIGPELGTASIIAVGQEFIRQTSTGEPTEETSLNELREITEKEIRLETQLPDLKKSEEIFDNGIRLSSEYNQVSLEYSAEKIGNTEYFSKLFDFRIKYEKYMTAMDSYIGDEDILIQKNSMTQELKEINQQINILKNSESFEEGWEQASQYDKYKKFLPTMFAP